MTSGRSGKFVFSSFQEKAMTPIFKIKCSRVHKHYADIVESSYPAGADEELNRAIIKQGVTPCQLLS